jgi:hypothetical protein
MSKSWLPNPVIEKTSSTAYIPITQNEKAKLDIVENTLPFASRYFFTMTQNAHCDVV